MTSKNNTLYREFLILWTVWRWCSFISEIQYLPVVIFLFIYFFRHCFSWPRNLSWCHINTVTLSATKESCVWWWGEEPGKENYFGMWLNTANHAHNSLSLFFSPLSVTNFHSFISFAQQCIKTTSLFHRTWSTIKKMNGVTYVVFVCLCHLVLL